MGIDLSLLGGRFDCIYCYPEGEHKPSVCISDCERGLLGTNSTLTRLYSLT